MTDNVSRRTRSKIMRANKSSGTGPERILARAVATHGIRSKPNDRRVLGTPDLCFPKARLAVFVDGCFWHGCPIHYRPPKSRVAYWSRRIAHTQRTDRANTAQLQADGWRVLRYWECGVKFSPETYGALVAAEYRFGLAARAKQAKEA